VPDDALDMLYRMSSNYRAKSTAIIFGILMITMITAPICGGVGTHDIPALMLVLVTGLVCPFCWEAMHGSGGPPSKS